MTYYGAKDLASAFRTVRDNTIKVAEDIGEEHYGFRATPETRSIAETLVHIATVPPKMAHEIHAVRKLTTFVGFDFMGVLGPVFAEEKKPRSKAEIIQLLKADRDFTSNWIENMSEASLAETVTMMPGATPPSKSRFEMLMGLKEHEMHHRGQLMLMQRMVGGVPHLTRQMQARMAEMQARTQGSGKA